MKSSKILQFLFLVVGVLTALEFIFIRGMFSWLIAVVATVVVGVLNVSASLKNKELLLAALYILSTVALCMGYFVLA